MSQKFENQTVMGIQSHKLLKGRENPPKNTLN